jgi:spore maturation protein CgeB
MVQKAMNIFYVTYKNNYTRDWKATGRLADVYYTTYLPLVKIGKERGHAIRPFWVDEVILEKGETGMSHALREAIFTEKPDVCLFDSDFEDNFNKRVLAEIKERSPALTVYICGDDSWNFDNESKHFAPYFSWIVTCYFGAVRRYRALGYTQVISWQSGANTEFLKPLDIPKDIDVSFVGTWGASRGKIIHDLRKAGINVVVRGNGWPGGGVSSDEMLNILSRSKIGLCLNQASFYVGWRPIARLFFRRARLGEGGVPVKWDAANFLDNIRTWRQKKIPNIKSRNFEIPALRIMQITQHADNLEEYYAPGKEIVFHTTTQDLIDKIRYYLSHPGEREAIAEKGYERTIRDHTRDKRLYELFSKIGRPL